METQSQIQQLFRRYLNGECNVSEINELLQYFELEQNEFVLKKNIDDYFSSAGHLSTGDQYDTAVNEIEDKLIGQIREIGVTKKSISLWPRIVAAASIVLVMGTALYYYVGSSREQVATEAFVNDVAPGKNGATLTLASGKKILINDAIAGEIASESGVRISKSKDGQILYVISAEQQENTTTGYNTLSTSRGQQSQVRLPDGTLVFLNAESSLTYPVSFASAAKRQVSLTGEGYFEVAKDKTHPFIVKTARQDVEVLGTHFNINAYAVERVVKTTLLEGSVRVSALGTSKVLKPDQQAVLASDGKINVSNADVSVAVAWKNDQFMFDSENIQAVMRMVERWYNVEIVYVGEITDEKFWGGVSRFDNVSKVLKSLESTGKVHFKIQGRKIYVSK